MALNLPFFDSSYLVRLYLEDAGFERVRQLAAEAPALASSWHAQAEMLAAFHRAYREGRFNKERYQVVLKQFKKEQHNGPFVWYEINDKVQVRLENVFRSAPTSVYLRSADGLHLACAAEHGFKEVYSNDRHLLAAAPLFGLKAINVFAPPA